MFGLHRRQWLGVLLALVLLRMVIGLHFFWEGADKHRSGQFDSAPFLTSAQGPFAEYYHRLVDDHDGRWRLCIRPPKEPGGPARIDPEITIAIWRDFVDRAKDHFQFEDPLLLSVLRDQLATTEQPAQRAELESKIDRLAQQNQRAKQILAEHEQRLQQFLDENRDELRVYANTAGRLKGFERDGPARSRAAVETPSLRQQINQIRSERWQALRTWTDEIEAIWDSLEWQINRLPIEAQLAAGELTLHRPYAPETSPHQWINTIVPWFDMIVGGLLLVGLFTRLAAVAGALFLVAVILSQPFWVPGTQDTWFQWVELSGLLVIAATAAGRVGGLDYFIFRMTRGMQGDRAPVE